MIRIPRGLAKALVLLVLIGASAARAEGRPPWKIGDVPVEGWVVMDRFLHEEFSRFSLSKDGAVTCVEVRYRGAGDPPEWCSRHYRIQPCPGFEADEPVLRALLIWLRTWEQLPVHTRFVERVSIPEDFKPPPEPPWRLTPVLAQAALNGLALLGFLLLLANWLRMRKQDRLAVIAGAGLAAAAVSALLLWGDPGRIPAGWVTVLHEGYGYQNLMQLSGIGVHAGDNFLRLQDLWSGGAAALGGGAVLRITVFVNICLAVANSAAFFVVVFLMTRKILAAGFFTALLVANIGTLHGIVSETPAQLLLAYFLMGTVAAAHLNQRERIGWLAAGLASFELGLLGYLICATRQEMIVMVFPALMAGAAQLFSLGPRISGWLVRLWRAAVRNWRWVLPSAVLVAAASIWWWVGYKYPGDPRVGWAIDGIYPFNPSFLTPPRFLLVYLPLGLVILFVLGVVGALRHPLRSYLLPLSLLVLWRVYYSASHGYGGPFYERFRFLTLLTPVCIFLAVYSLQEIERWRERISWIRAHARIVAVVLGLTFCVFWPRGWDAYFGQGHRLPGVSGHRALLSRNQQTEVRYLLDLIDRHPDCAFLSRTMKYTRRGKPDYYWGRFGKKMPMVLFPEEPGDTLEKVASQYMPDQSCIFFYYGLDCNKQSSDRCLAQIKDRPVAEEHLLENLQYTDFHGSDSYPEKIRLALLLVR